jgi:hypothetical protein
MDISDTRQGACRINPHRRQEADLQENDFEQIAHSASHPRGRPSSVPSSAVGAGRTIGRENGEHGVEKNN